MASKVRLAPLTIVRHATPLLLEAALGRSASSGGSSPLPSVPRLGHLILGLRIASPFAAACGAELEFGQAISLTFITATSCGSELGFSACTRGKTTMVSSLWGHPPKSAQSTVSPKRSRQGS